MGIFIWVFLQLILLGVIALVFIFISGWFGAKSVLLGGGAWVIPYLYFNWRMSRVKTIFDMQTMLKGFLLNEAVKLLLSFGIVILILLTLAIDTKGFLVGYVAMVLLSSLSFFM